MSPVANPPQPPAKSKKEKERERREKAAQQQSTERLKTVVRRLPPNLPEDIFWQTIKPWVTEETSTWKAYYAGKFKKRDNKENIPSRAYIAFKNEELLANFSRDFDGHLFKDKAGNESYAIVEFAPYQKIPSEKRKPDNKNATIEKDEDYISFIQSLNASAAAEPVTIDSLLAATRPASPPKTTPLLEALKAEKSAQKDKEAILRNHQHYKDQANVTAVAGVGGSSRKEEKKKAAAAQAAQAQTAKQAAVAPPAPTKKGKKGKEPAQAQKQGPPPSKVNNGPGPADPKASGSNVQAQPPPKHPRQKHAKPGPPAQNTNATPLPQVTIVQPAKTSAPAPKSTAPPAPAAVPVQNGDAATSVPPSRRPRAGLNLSGRHFEAALAGVGAPRLRREKDSAVTPTSPVGGLTTQGASSGDGPKPIQATPSVSTKDKGPANSPPRNRNRRGGPPTTATAHPTAQPVVNIVKAPVILQREAPTGPAQGTPGVAVPPVIASAPSQSSDRGGRGGRRGRGRGGGGPRGGARGG